MNAKYGIIVLFAGFIATVIVRAPHESRNKKIPIERSHKGGLEIALLSLMFVGVLVVPIVYATTSLLSFADYPLHTLSFWLGTALMAIGAWIFYRSHADLGTNWSPTLEVRKNHSLITTGIYRRIRHPMYTSLYLYAVAQMLLLPNWVAGPACFATFTLMFVFRVRIEERMMIEKFGDEYRTYAGKTKRLVPYIW
jgi:protein-S-isoprenylcysteine O-methyltransferase Ste14